MTSKTTNKFSPEVRARAVRMVLDHSSEHPFAILRRVESLLQLSNLCDGARNVVLFQPVNYDRTFGEAFRVLGYAIMPPPAQ
jgi:hypothetical protein